MAVVESSVRASWAGYQVEDVDFDGGVPSQHSIHAALHLLILEICLGTSRVVNE